MNDSAIRSASLVEAITNSYIVGATGGYHI
jgi:hypothetical protein